MPNYGDALKIRFGVTNQLGVVSNDLEGASAAPAPDPSVFISEVNPLFGGELINLSVQIYRLTDAEKQARLVMCPDRYSRYACAGVYYNTSSPKDKLGFYLTGLGPWVGPDEVRAFIFANAKMADDSIPNFCFVGAFKALS